MKLNKDFINKLPQLFLLIAILSGNIVSPLYAFANDVLPEKKIVQDLKLEEVDSVGEITKIAASIGPEEEIIEKDQTEEPSIMGVTASVTGKSFWYPSKPILRSPIGGVVINSNTPLMQWEDSKPGLLSWGKIKKYNYEYKYNCEGTTVNTCKQTYTETTTKSEYQAGNTADGRGFWRVRAVNDWDIKSEWSDYAEFTVDTKAPSIPTLISPANGAYVQGTSVSNVWEKIEDADHYEYESYHDEELKNNRWRETYTSNSKTATNVEDATFWWRVRAVDKAGNKSEWSEAWKIIVDSTRPTAEIIAAEFTKGDTEIKGKAFDNEGIKGHWFEIIDPNGKTFYINKALNNPTEEVTFNLSEAKNNDKESIELIDGQYRIRYVVTDLAGNRSDDPNYSNNTIHYIVIDSIRPVMEVITPTEGQVLRSDAIKVNVKVTDNQGLTILVINLYKEGTLFKSFSKALEGETEFSYEHDLTGLNLEDGKYYVKANARDKAGTISNTVTRNFVIDNTAPVLKVDTIIDGYSNTLNPQIHATDANPFQIFVKRNGGIVRIATAKEKTDGTYSSWFGIDYMPDGKYEVQAVDEAGNTSGIISFVLDRVSPTIEGVTVENDITNEDTINVYGKVFDENIKDFNLRIFDSSKTVQVSPWRGSTVKENKEGLLGTFDVSDLTDGEYYVRIWADDKAGNDVGRSPHIYVKFIVDRTDPVTEPTPQTPEPEPTIPPSTEEGGEVAGVTTANTKTSTTNRTGKNTVTPRTNAVETTTEELGEEEDTQEVLGEEEKVENSCEANKKINGNIFIDKNNNDKLDEGEKGIKNIKVQIYVMENGEKKIIEEVTTDKDGYFETTGVCEGKYNIQIEEETLPKGHELKGEATREIVITDTDTEENEGAYLGVSVEDNRSFIQKYWYLILIIPVIGYALFKKRKENK